MKADAVLAAVHLIVHINIPQLRTVLAPLVVAAKKSEGMKGGDRKMPLNRGSLMEQYHQWVVVEERKRRIVENDEITVVEQLANEATNGAAEPASASNSES